VPGSRGQSGLPRPYRVDDITDRIDHHLRLVDVDVMRAVPDLDAEPGPPRRSNGPDPNNVPRPNN
jgi:hypothetical protein